MTACPEQRVLTKAIFGGDDPATAAHLATCARCRASWDGTRRAIDVARQRDVPMPTDEQREEMRTAILAAHRAEPGPRPIGSRPRRARWRWAAALAASAAVAVAVSARSRAPRAGHAHATIRPHLGASYTTATAAPDESVMLQDGSIDVEVTPMHAGERFRVILANAQLEVHGTAFVATARAGQLVGVVVTHGVVEVRAVGAPAQRLTAGESWAAPVAVAGPVSVAPPNAPAAAAPEMTVPPPHRPPVAVVAPRAPRRGVPAHDVQRPDPDRAIGPAATRPVHEAAYDDAWSAMRAGEFARAAAAFARVQTLDPGGRLAEDASLWAAVALERSGASAQAAAGFRDFIARFPASPRAGEASAMLGWILVAADQPAEAERRFRAALGDPLPAVRDSATAGVEAVARMTSRAPD